MTELKAENWERQKELRQKITSIQKENSDKLQLLQVGLQCTSLGNYMAVLKWIVFAAVLHVLELLDNYVSSCNTCTTLVSKSLWRHMFHAHVLTT